MPPEQALVHVINLLAKLDAPQLLRVVRCAEHLLEERAQQLSLLKDYAKGTEEQILQQRY